MLLVDQYTFDLQFSEDVTAINASPDMVVNYPGGTGFDDIAIVNGKLRVTAGDTLFAPQWLTTITYHPDGALSFANGGDVPDTQTWTLDAGATIPVLQAAVAGATTVGITPANWCYAYDGDPANILLTKNGTPCPITNVAFSNGQITLTTSTNISTGTIVLTMPDEDWELFPNRFQRIMPLTPLTLPYGP